MVWGAASSSRSITYKYVVVVLVVPVAVPEYELIYEVRNYYSIIELQIDIATWSFK